jgi:hypothetical protein
MDRDVIAVRQFLANAYFLFSTLIYFPILGKLTETQPVIAALLAAITVSWLLIQGMFSLRINAFLLGYLIFIAFIIFHSLTLANIVQWTEIPRYLVGPMFFMAAVYYAPYVGINAVRIPVIYFALGGLLALIAYPVYLNLNDYLCTGSASAVGFGLRGLRYFTPEPSYAVIAIFHVIALAFILKVRRSYMLFGFLALTLSSYAVILSLIMLAAYVIRRRNFIMASAGFVMAVILVVIIMNTDTRAGQLLTNLSSISSGDMMKAFAFVDPSASTRALKFIASGYGFITNFLGSGIGSFQAIYWQHFADMGWTWVLQHGVIGPLIYNRLSLEPGSYVMAIIHDLGIFGLAFVTAFFWRIRVAIGNTAWQTGLFLCACFMLGVQAQLTNPVPWNILALLYFTCRRNKSCLSAP